MSKKKREIKTATTNIVFTNVFSEKLNANNRIFFSLQFTVDHGNKCQIFQQYTLNTYFADIFLSHTKKILSINLQKTAKCVGL